MYKPLFEELCTNYKIKSVFIRSKKSNAKAPFCVLTPFY